MKKIYNTEELIEFLNSERESLARTGKSKLSPPKGDWHPALKNIIGTERLQQTEFYHDIREEVWKYQAFHNISAIVWKKVDILGQTLRYPDTDSQLLLRVEDIELMQRHKNKVFDYWQKVTVGMNLLRSVGANAHEPISRDFVKILSALSEWATISTARFDQQAKSWQLDPENPEINLQLGCGDSEIIDDEEWIIAFPPDRNNTVRHSRPTVLSTYRSCEVGMAALN